MGVKYNHPPICPRCKNQLAKGEVEIWGDDDAPTFAWECKQKECPVNTFVMREGETNTFRNWKVKHGKK